MIKAYILSKEKETTKIAPEQIINRVLDGDVILVKNALQHIDIFQQIVDTTFSVISEKFGTQVEADVRNRGFEKIHEVLSGTQIEELVNGVYERLVDINIRYTKKIGKEILGIRKPFFIQRAFLVRLFVPHDILQKNYKIFSQRKYLGRLNLQSPHHDYWHHVPLNTINLWIAVSSVKRDNGLSIYNDVWGSDLKCHNGYIAKDQYIGTPITIDCDPGDIVIFHSRHMHSSVLNSSEFTRYVMTSRLLLERPLTLKVGQLDKVCYYSSLVGTKLERFSTAISKISWFYIRERCKAYISKFIENVENRINFEPVKSFCKKIRRKLRYRAGDIKITVPEKLMRSKYLAQNFSDISENEIIPIGTSICLAKVDGQLYAFERHCPHQGADLTLGYVKDGKVYCPWHNYCIDPKTGSGSCSTLKSLKTYNAKEVLRKLEPQST